MRTHYRIRTFEEYLATPTRGGLAGLLAAANLGNLLRELHRPGRLDQFRVRQISD